MKTRKSYLSVDGALGRGRWLMRAYALDWREQRAGLLTSEARWEQEWFSEESVRCLKSAIYWREVSRMAALRV